MEIKNIKGIGSMEEIKDILLQLYNNKDITIGAHGTAINPLSNQPQIICNEGLMCRYGDLRRTVAFQDRGLIHAHGNITFEDLLQYKYAKSQKGYINETKQIDNYIKNEVKEIDLDQCTFIFGIPSEQSTIDDNLFSGEKRKFKRECCYSKDELRLGTEQYGRPINPKYIVGYYLNGDISTMQFNEKFYGFKAKEKGVTSLAEIDTDKIREENENVKERNKQKECIDQEMLSKEATNIMKEKSKGTIEKVKMLLSKIIKGKEKETRGER